MPHVNDPFDMTGTLDTSGYGAPVSTPVRYRLPISNAAFEGDQGFIDVYDDTSIFAVTAWSVTTNVVTLTTSANHGFTTGQRVIVVGVDKTIDGSYVLASGATTTMTFALTHVNGSGTIITGQAAVGLAVTIPGLAGMPMSVSDVVPAFNQTYDTLVANVAAVATEGTQPAQGSPFTSSGTIVGHQPQNRS